MFVRMTVCNRTARALRKGSMVHIPPGVVHGAVGKMRVLVVGIPDIDDSDVYYV